MVVSGLYMEWDGCGNVVVVEVVDLLRWRWSPQLLHHHRPGHLQLWMMGMMILMTNISLSKNITIMAIFGHVLLLMIAPSVWAGTLLWPNIQLLGLVPDFLSHMEGVKVEGGAGQERLSWQGYKHWNVIVL